MIINFPRWYAQLLDSLDRDRDPESSTPPRPEAFPAIPSAGEIYAYRTTPFFEFSNPIPEAYAAVKVLAVDAKGICFAILDGIWLKPPTVRQAARRSVLVEHRWNQAPVPCVYRSVCEGFNLLDLSYVSRVGVVSLNGIESRLTKAVSRYTVLVNATQAPEGERRWRTDRKAFVAETAESEARDTAERQAREELDKTRLARLTWASWTDQSLFPFWNDKPDSPREAFMIASRDRVRAAGGALQALGAKPRKSDARRILKACVLAFNTADEATGMIYTMEREDILSALNDLSVLAGHPSLIEEFEVWRTW
jgi:hypothetical protein